MRHCCVSTLLIYLYAIKLTQIKIQELKELNFKFIKETNKVEVRTNGQLLVIEVDESEDFLSDLVNLNQIKNLKSNVINRKQRAWWQRTSI